MALGPASRLSVACAVAPGFSLKSPVDGAWCAGLQREGCGVPLSNQVELLAAVRHRLETRFGAPVSLEVPEVDWDRRLVVRATLVDGRRAFVKIDFSLPARSERL